MAKTKTKELDEFSKLILDEIKNPLTISVEITRDIDFDKSFPYPLTALTVYIKQKARVEDYGTGDEDSNA